jgi:hypothetical protein
MFQDLYRLYKKNGYSDRIPLEDFNTEIFAGILNLFPEIKDEIILFLDLPADDYEIETQVKYTLPKEDDPDCIVDLVIKGNKNVCFIENKINSTEGYRQLERYSIALEEYFSKHEKNLVYCTKFADTKKITTHNFKQIRWYEIAKRLKKYSYKNSTVKDYLKFLKIHKMAQDNTFTTEAILSMQNLTKTLEIVNHHIDLSESNFKKIFNINKTNTKQTNFTNLNRIAIYVKDIFIDKTISSDLLYSINFNNVKLQTQVWVAKKHPDIIKIEALAKNNNFETYKTSGGLIIYKCRPLYDLLNNHNSDNIIKDWFTLSFNEFKEFIDSTPELEWDIK